MNLIDLAGIAGAITVMTAYALSTAHSSRVPAKLQAVLNLGAGALALNAAAHQAWPSMVLNAVWFLLAAGALRLRSSTPRNDPEPAGSASAAGRDQPVSRPGPRVAPEPRQVCRAVS